MTPYQAAWLEGVARSRSGTGRWARLIAPIITAILVIALGVTVFGLMSSECSPDASPQPAVIEPPH